MVLLPVISLSFRAFSRSGSTSAALTNEAPPNAAASTITATGQLTSLLMTSPPVFSAQIRTFSPGVILSLLYFYRHIDSCQVQTRGSSSGIFYLDSAPPRFLC